MSVEELLKALVGAESVDEAENTVSHFTAATPEAAWVAVGGRPNNRGIIEVSANPGRAVVERVTNAIDAVLDAEFQRHDGKPDCRSPRQAASAWLNVPDDGLSAMSAVERRKLAKLVTVRLAEGDGAARRIIEVFDHGTGLSADEMPSTILSLNESNKVQKPHLAGTYGQGGSATFASSELSLIASRVEGSAEIAFTVVRFEPPPPEAIKGGSYVYLTVNGGLLTTSQMTDLQEPGTRCIHFGYDLTKLTSPLGPNSVYGLLQQVMFHPVLPIWFDNRVHNYRRVIKGSRNALNGAVDEGDDTKGPELAHNMPMFYVSLGEYGRIGIEYWLLERPEKNRKRPTASFVDPMKPIILTLNGQNQAEMGVRVIRKEAELPFLGQRLVCHIDCNSLTPAALRSLFSSNREEARKGAVFGMLEGELISALRSDDELTRLNAEARDQKHRDEDEDVSKRMRKEVAKLLRIQGFEVATATGAVAGGPDKDPRPSSKPRHSPKPRPIDLKEPPTYLKILWPEDDEIGLYPDQRRYVRIETDAHSNHHDPRDPRLSHVNVVVSGAGLQASGSTALRGGRMRVIISCAADATQGESGRMQVELRVPGLSTLSDARELAVVAPPKARGAQQKIVMPPFNVEPVDGPDDSRWLDLGWPDNVSSVASSAIASGKELTVYYSKVFPRYLEYTKKLEGQDPSLAASFDARYRIWLAVHSLILEKEKNERDEGLADGVAEEPKDDQWAEEAERTERCRVATIAAMFAAQEVTRPMTDDEI